ncbi:Sugar phosphate isomerase/epimerase [Alkalispirochaeta americana]|uniref:Sugar phosphate isomerase/epimerase n=1 Tax=Alkalispirochaeta americana TaxID=159291 RepID=A0A1N6UKK4_9SPIO|nr:sugar phosphate isomerase/epimerase [Alkalispirochaeta americana]SIQ66062.1 Sugar phosphate isomerase/epimerase [Alkalispirochaeta americana]
MARVVTARVVTGRGTGTKAAADKTRCLRYDGTIQDRKEASMEIALGVNTDYSGDRGSPGPALEEIALAGFSHVMWGHHWNTDFLYTQPEICAIASRMNELGLFLMDTHGSSGVEKCWYSSCEYERLAGVELIRNRVDMTVCLGGDTVVLHPMITDPSRIDQWRSQGEKSLRELEQYVRNSGVSLVLENLFQSDHLEERDRSLQGFETLEYFFERFDAGYLGFCWDTGHAFILGEKAFAWSCDLARNRLRTLHLNDNRGDADQHSPPLTWDSPWTTIAEVIAASPYPPGKPLLFEIDARTNGGEPRSFLAGARQKAEDFSALVSSARSRNRAGTGNQGQPSRHGREG